MMLIRNSMHFPARTTTVMPSPFAVSFNLIKSSSQIDVISCNMLSKGIVTMHCFLACCEGEHSQNKRQPIVIRPTSQPKHMLPTACEVNGSLTMILSPNSCKNAHLVFMLKQRRGGHTAMRQPSISIISVIGSSLSTQ